MKKYLFIINPKSGTQTKSSLETQIAILLDLNQFEIQYTEYPRHAVEICKKAIERGFDCIVAVGGDGTVNEVASQLVNSNVALGIIPSGSGNGFARHLNIPLQSEKAIKHLLNAKIITVDVLKVNENISCNTCGIGFAAQVAKIFGHDGKRGFLTYLKLGLTGFSSYESFSVEIAGKTYDNLLTLEIANSSQMGNNAIISPFSSITDGIAEIVMLKKPKWWQVPKIIFQIFSKTLPNSPHVTFLNYSDQKIIVNRIIEHHIDGEYIDELRELNFKILSNQLKLKV